MKIALTIIFTIAMFPLFAASGYATIAISGLHIGENEIPWYSEMKWTMQNIQICYGDLPTNVCAGLSPIDTIYYQRSNKEKADTIICKFIAGETYEIVYNPCCGGFNMGAIKSSRNRTAQASFSAPYAKKALVCGVGTSYTILNDGRPAVFKEVCRSAMAPTATWITVTTGDITYGQPCKQDDLFCLVDHNGEFLEKAEVCYSQQKVYTSFLYLPLNNEQIDVAIKKEHKISVSISPMKK